MSKYCETCAVFIPHEMSVYPHAMIQWGIDGWCGNAHHKTLDGSCFSILNRHTTTCARHVEHTYARPEHTEENTCCT